MEVTRASMGGVAEAVERVAERIVRAAERAGRPPDDVRLIAVSKGFDVTRVEQAALAGQMDFGENRVQELAAKYSDAPGDLRWHFVGRLQTNKVKQLLPMVDTIHSVDRVGLARQIDKQIDKKQIEPVKVLVEVNASGDPRKAGVAPEGVEELIEQVLQMPNLDLVGLMTMAHRTEDPETTREVFRRLARLRERAVETFSCARIRHLSMGMSQDYEVAVEEGSTMVRVGEAIFGRRDPVGLVGERQASAHTKSRER
ncbi:MAG: YggS family pyridoxal phosphate-dependent enzyme [Actinomycetota bacterium]